MLETQQSITIDAGIDRVWSYVSEIPKWANLMPGCQDCTVIDAHDSRWVLKVGVGGLVRTVRVLVHVDEWDAPGRVGFSYRLDGDPVNGTGSYIALRKSAQETDVSFSLRVIGSGPLAPMWEAMCRPLLPQLARSFAGKLKAEIERTPGAAEPPHSTESDAPSVVLRMAGKLRALWRAVFGQPG